ncbi:redox-sensing transcriptional repressor [Candidatus Hakubella thermalkaliphila]|uniref:Redox-sensing transcriptional repressor Rex n=1 Tax=Candidatus Hakubella thermalkaliphila TaxID=2754717 RepID=A0A6V8NNN6_9ACTN|nr:redox-sensing transcriptional repressor Rex [Candidatus Hakubella thermalkaliphila]GFP20910.1 redox-sensing transcriptional repressor [Candidatus Hakubella thermalkaliphila]
MRRTQIAEKTLNRLFLYVDYLKEMAQQRRTIVSSQQLAEAVGVKSCLLRKDLSRLGSFGCPRVGYQVDVLLNRLSAHLGLNEEISVVVIARCGFASDLSICRCLPEHNFKIAGFFYDGPQRPQASACTQEVLPIDLLDEVVRDNKVTMAIIASPPFSPQRIVDRLVAAGVKSILNLCGPPVSVPEEVSLRRADAIHHLRVLAFYNSHTDEKS